MWDWLTGLAVSILSASGVFPGHQRPAGSSTVNRLRAQASLKRSRCFLLGGCEAGDRIPNEVSESGGSGALVQAFLQYAGHIARALVASRLREPAFEFPDWHH